MTLFHSKNPVVTLTGRLPRPKEENLLECRLSSQGANALAGVSFTYAGQGDYHIDLGRLDTKAKLTRDKKKYSGKKHADKKHPGKGQEAVLKAVGEKRFSAGYEAGQFAGSRM